MGRILYPLEFIEGLVSVGFAPDSCKQALSIARGEFDQLKSDGNYREQRIDQYLVICDGNAAWVADEKEAWSKAEKSKGSFLFHCRPNQFTHSLDLLSLKDDPYALSRENLSDLFGKDLP